MAGAWEQVTDDEGRVYYYNTATNETAWELPADAASQTVPTEPVESKWQKYTTDDGQVYYYNTETQESSWDVPEELKGAEQGQTVPAAHTAAAGSPGKEEDEDVQELASQYPNTSQIADKRLVTSMTQKQLEVSKEKFVAMLQEAQVDSNWSFTKVMENFISDARYWEIPDPSMRKELYEGYLMNKAEEEYKQSLDSRELFKNNFIKVLQKHDVHYYTRWKTCSNKILDEPIYSLAGEKLKRDIFQQYVSELRADHDKELSELKRQGLEELETYMVRDLKLCVSSNFDEALQKMKADTRFQENKHFQYLHDLDILQLYDTIVKKSEYFQNSKLRYHRIRNHNRDRAARQSYRDFLKASAFKVTPRTTWFEFSRAVKDAPEFSALLGRSGSSPIDYFWDALNESQQFLNAQRNLAVSKFLDLGIDVRRDLDSVEKFTKTCHDNGLFVDLHQDEVSYIYESVLTNGPDDRKRELSPSSARAQNYRSQRDEPDRTESKQPTTTATATATTTTTTTKVAAELDY